jgi:hypothetical protein
LDIHVLTLVEHAIVYSQLEVAFEPESHTMILEKLQEHQQLAEEGYCAIKYDKELSKKSWEIRKTND